jgi:hypothetical protein
MRTVYRVTVAAVNYDDEGNFVSDETLFEATHHRPGALLRFAPTEVDDALRVVAADGVAPAVDAAPVSVPEWDRATEPQPVDAAAPQAETSVTKRKRRTRAEIEAERAAAVASQAGADPGPANQEALAASVPAEVTEPEPPVAEPPAEPVPAEVPASVAERVPEPGAQPWNPFQQR